MDDKLFKELESNLGKAVRYAKGKATATEYLVLSPEDIKAIRLKIKMSQTDFAREFQLKLDTIKGWEQGKRRPDAAAMNYLRVIKANPEFVQKTIAA